MLDITKIDMTRDITQRDFTFKTDKDYWGSRQSYNEGKFVGNLYYYYVDSELLKLAGKLNNSVPVPPLDAIMNVSFMPYLNRDDLDLKLVKLDTERFVGNLGTGGDMIENTVLLRVDNPQHDITKTLGSINPYKVERVGGSRYHWSNEGKLWQYPYCYTQLVDGLGQEIELIPYLFSNPSASKAVKVVTPINSMGIYSIYIDGYKNINDKLINANVNNSPKTVPITSSPYSSFLSSNQSQLAVQQQQQRFDKGVGTAKGLTGLLSSAMNIATSGGMSGYDQVLGNMVNMGQVHVQDMLNTKNMIAQQRDMNKVALTAVDMGSDVIFNKFNGNGYLNAYRVRMHDTYMEQLGAFFHLYGYAQNKLMPVNIRNRYYFNYIKTSSINITGEGIPKADLEELKSIYNNGVTIWHIDRQGVSVGDYSMDNYEI